MSTRNIEVYDFHDIPIDVDCCLCDEVNLKEYESALLRFLEDGEYPIVGGVSFVIPERINKNSIEMCWILNQSTRCHRLNIILPKDKFIKCIAYSPYRVQPQIFVEHAWFEEHVERKYSIFALIDAINFEYEIRNGSLTRENLLILRDEIDGLAEKDQNIAFISFADSILLKTEWVPSYFAKDIKCNYFPEQIIKVISSIRDIYRHVLGLNIYAIISQGHNEYYKDTLIHVSNLKNHISLNSLGIPFAEIFAIDNAVRKAIKNNIHPASEIYMDEYFYNSLNLRMEFKINNSNQKPYASKMKSGGCNYFYHDCDKLMANLC